jgi:hypothetical protein
MMKRMFPLVPALLLGFLVFVIETSKASESVRLLKIIAVNLILIGLSLLFEVDRIRRLLEEKVKNAK